MDDNSNQGGLVRWQLVTEVDYPDGSTVKAHYDALGNLLDETDALGQMTEYLNGDDGVPHTIIDPPSSANTCGGTPWPRWNASRTARAKAPTTATTTATT